MKPVNTLTLITALFISAGAGFAADLNQASGKTILFVGNSFTYGAGSPVQNFNVQSVTDLNGGKKGGVPALFKCFTEQARLRYAVSLETVPGKNLDYHFQKKAKVLARSWDDVVLQGYSLLDKDKPGNAGVLIQATRQIAGLLETKNPQVEIWMVATWARADQVYQKSGHWFGKPIATMTGDIRAGYDLAKAATPRVRQVIPVGEAWKQALQAGIADPNPYDGIAPGQLDLWANDHYHASRYGSYLSALTIFGAVTGLDPRSLGDKEVAAGKLGFTPEQVHQLQQIAYAELAASGTPMKSFTHIAEVEIK